MFSFNDLPVLDEKKLYDGIFGFSELISKAASGVATNVVQATTSAYAYYVTPTQDPLERRLKNARKNLEETRLAFEAEKQEVAALQSEVQKARKIDEVSVISASLFKTSSVNQPGSEGKIAALKMDEEALAGDQVAVKETLATITVAIGSLKDDLNTAIKIEEVKIEEAKNQLTRF